MKVELFTLADGAYNYNGKMTIVGTKDGFNVTSLPDKRNFALALKLFALSGESFKGNMHIRIKDPEGTLMPSEMTLNLNLEPSPEDSHIAIAVTIQNFPLLKEGIHSVEVLLEEDIIGVYSFYVHKKSN